MTRAAAPIPATGGARELAELFAEFNQVTARLHETHERLAAEVARLKKELRETRSQLRRKTELAALGEMAAGIAHEIRNPLGSIGLYASMLREDLGDRPAQMDIAQRICSAVRGMDRIVGDVLSFAREVRLRPEEVDAAELVERAVSACAADAERAGVRVEVGPSREVVVCDASLAHQALVNVVRNACEATGEKAAAGGVVRVSARRTSLLMEDGRAAPAVAISVEDNGPGVSDEVKRRMFNPFFTTRAAGTGLGLAIVHRIMDAHGGRVTVENRHGPAGAAGAVVELQFPAEARRTAGEHEEAQGGGT